MSWVGYALTLLVTYSVYLTVAVGLNLVVGYGGRLTLAQGALFGAGAYAYALVGMRGSSPVWPYAGLAAAAATGVALSLALSLCERRLRGDFFVIASLALQAILFGAFQNWQTPGEPLGTWRNLTNGTAGIAGIPRPWPFTSIEAFTALAVGFAAVATLAVRGLVNSPWGRLIRASRDDRLVAEGLGKPVLRIRIQAFALSGATAAIGGAVYAAYAQYVSPDLGSVNASVLFLSMVLIGGAGSQWGPVLGGAVLLAIEEGLRFFRVAELVKAGLPLFSNATFTDANLQLLLYGLLLLFLLRVRPAGLAGDPLVWRGPSGLES